ncbi:S8 family peptidase [Fluviicola chungangensis]|uniref:S8 family peptidase n=1 Tax=Fluviicola chungangensis TaxID=2597671 RepID=A0A556N605_9FLAO|nr:S8 family peptidase [Fluviicola chungangensis]TSJ47620.1 S8 family peptidase [Fluviicola chungangensis]
MADHYKHIFLSDNIKTEKYKAKGSVVPSKSLPSRERISHSQKLISQLAAIWARKKQLDQQRQAEQISVKEGTYLTFSSSANEELISKSLEDFRQGVRLLNVREIQINEDTKQTIATVYVPNGKEGFFVNKINSFKSKNNSSITFTEKKDHDILRQQISEFGNEIQVKKISDRSKLGLEHTHVTVLVPVGQEKYFTTEASKLDPEARVKVTPVNADLVNSIEDIGEALLESLWTDKVSNIPDETSKWCEVWLNVNTKDELEQEQISIFKTTLENIGIEYKDNTIVFPERAVLLINANQDQLIELMLQSDLLAEFRAGQEPAGFWVNENSMEQQAWIDNLLQRVELIDSNIKVCVLDSGVNNGHQLLSNLLDDTNTLTVDSNWGTNDHEEKAGHGTLMAGLAGYGEFESAFLSSNNIVITHKLCSVKILPPRNQEKTPKELWGDITVRGIALAEIQNPRSTLIYCMAVTSEDDADKGRPSSWSGAVDKAAFGDGDNQRLIIISGGNIRSEEIWKNYPNSNFTTTVENPAQSWNALTVGAYTEKVQINDTDHNDYKLVANKGELSPYSTTSINWNRKWPSKPDVVFEGGNLLRSPENTVISHKDLDLLSTSKSINIRPLNTINATSAATAQASCFAAKIAFEYPDAWMETIRGLIVHSSNWNSSMLAQLNVRQNNKTDYGNLLRVFGYGTPNLERALYSKESALTFVSQEVIQPFSFNSKGSPETNEIHFFDFPWPEDLLLSMSDTPVTLKITLSYFIEPGAGEIGWKDKYRYQSHGLRFDINNVDDIDENAFRKRINLAAREEDDEISGSSGSSRWTIGVKNRSTGSIHSDFWVGTAAEIATCKFIAVYPVIGWWRERKQEGKVENKTRYSLIVSLETPAEEIELYTTVKNIIEVPIEITTS